MTYVGSAGGQPRLTLPFSNLQSPPTAAEWNRTMRTLYTWANSLSSGGSGGGMLAFGVYGATGPSGNIVQWTAVADAAGMLGGDAETFTPPENAVALTLAASEFDAPVGTAGPLLYSLINTGGLIGVTPEYQVWGEAPNNPISSLFRALNFVGLWVDLVDTTVNPTFQIFATISGNFPVNTGLLVLAFAHP